MLIFSSTYASAKSSRPRAIAPTKTAMEWSCGRVGRYCERRCVLASPERAGDGVRVMYIGGKWNGRKKATQRTKFDGVRGEVVGDGVLDDFEQLLGSVDAADAQLVEELDHQAAEALERARDADVRVDLDEDALRGVDVHLQQAGLVQRRVEEGEEALFGCT
jgi:hypothetical protein